MVQANQKLALISVDRIIAALEEYERKEVNPRVKGYFLPREMARSISEILQNYPHICFPI